jgi:ArsR family transcriptional regulator
MSTRLLEIADRKLGERCCDPGLKPALNSRAASGLASDFELLAHPVRLQLLDVLARNEGRVCVCDLESAVPVKQPTVSHHLRLLREAGLIESEKVGQWVHYRVRRDALQRLHERLSQLLETIG